MLSPAPSTIHWFPASPSWDKFKFTFAPISGTAAAVERQSALGRGLRITEVPFPREARRRALIV